MKQLMNTVILAFIGLFTVTAQAEDALMTPGEIQACTINSGSSMNDVNATMAEVRAWLKAGGHNYDLWMAMPQYKPAVGYDFDFLMMGSWDSHAEEMSGLEAFYTTDSGRKIGQALQQVMACRGHQHVNNVQVRPDVAPDLQQGFGYMFDCSLAKGKGPSDVYNTFQDWNRYLDSNQIDHGVTAIFPSSGATEDRAGKFKFLWGGDFKNVGKTTAFLTRPEAVATWVKLSQKTYSCDTFDRGYFFQRISE